jgi:hypothetical protein
VHSLVMSVERDGEFIRPRPRSTNTIESEAIGGSTTLTSNGLYPPHIDHHLLRFFADQTPQFLSGAPSLRWSLQFAFKEQVTRYRSHRPKYSRVAYPSGYEAIPVACVARLEVVDNHYNLPIIISRDALDRCFQIAYLMRGWIQRRITLD